MAVRNPHLVHSMFSGPIPGQSLTHAPKSMPYEKPPQYTSVEEAVHSIMDNITEPVNLKPLLAMMDAGMPIEAIARSLIFGGFTFGKWTPDLAVLMYKPVMLALIAIAHRANIKDVPIVMPMSLEKYKKQQDQLMKIVQRANPSDEPKTASTPATSAPIGFMRKQ